MAPCARWSEWSDYGSCQASCGATGQQVRSRSCTLNNGSPSNQCTGGSSTSTRFCQGPACPALWANWQSWGSCQLDCTRSRQRNCRVNGQVVSQSRCSGFSSERLQCPGGCPSLDPPNGQSWVSWGSWSGYGICTRTCGGGTQTRYRRCYYLGRSNSPIGSDYCTFTHQTQSSDGRPCRTTPCPNTYTWTNWSPYGQCRSNAPGSCSGRQTSSRRCINPASNQQVQSPNCAPGVDTRTQSCNACQQDNTYGNWYAWGACSAPCHSGSNRPTRVRARCRTGTNCTQQSHWDIVTENCNTNPC
uniref:Uncharacterized protein n=1 Tax=Ciona savignyi TaxID=51511 RepID=H2YT54_CIOSA